MRRRLRDDHALNVNLIDNLSAKDLHRHLNLLGLESAMMKSFGEPQPLGSGPRHTLKYRVSADAKLEHPSTATVQINALIQNGLAVLRSMNFS